MRWKIRDAPSEPAEPNILKINADAAKVPSLSLRQMDAPVLLLGIFVWSRRASLLVVDAENKNGSERSGDNPSLSAENLHGIGLKRAHPICRFAFIFPK